nr:uncharacterized protein LOC109149872 [Ipomoea batatas]
MSSDDSQNYSARDYDDQYDDEVISESGGSSPGHSDDVEVVDARPVGGRPAKARPTAPLQSTSSKAPLKKKVQKGEGSSSKPKGKSTSKPKTTGGNDVELGADDTPTEITVREEEQIAGLGGKTSTGGQTSRSLKVVIKKKSITSSADQHTAGHPPLESRQSDSFVAPDQNKSTGKRPMEVAEADPPTDVHAADPKRARLSGEKPGLTDALARGAFSLPEMFNMLFQMSPPPADFTHEKTDYVAGQVAHHISQAASGAAELFVRATVDVTHRDQ